jgi:hypothetical protein
MSKIQISPNASGSGTVTLAAPNTNSDVTLTIPAVSAELITNSSGVLNIGSGQIYKAADGSVGIGTSSPAVKLDVNKGSEGEYLRAGGDDTGNNGRALRFTSSTGGGFIGALHTLNAPSSGGTIAFATNSTERMRIDASGNLLVGTTGTPNGTSVYGSAFIGEANDRRALYLASSSTATGIGLVRFYNPNGVVGTITTSATATSYGTSSDYRLKENVAPMTGALAKVAALKPCTYTWKADGSQGQGFIAHELQEVVPDCVTGEKDAVEIVDDFDDEGNKIGTKEVPRYQGVDTSFLVATLVAAIQEQQTLIADLTTRLEALEAI